MKRIRVLLVVWRLSISGGKPFVIRQLLRSIDHARFDVHVLSIRPLIDEDRLDELGPDITFHTLDHVGSVAAVRRTWLAWGVHRTMTEVRPDVLHVQSGIAWYAAGTALLRRKPRARLIEVHDAPQSGRRRRMNDLVEKLMIRGLGFEPIVHSRSVRDDLAAATGIDPAACHLISLGIDVQHYTTPVRDRAQVRAELGVPEEAIVVMYTARMVPTKRPELFVDVAERFAGRPELAFVLAGGGQLLEPIRQEVARRGLAGRVQVLGFVDDLVSLCNAADVFLSTSEYEGFGLAIAEAMASGLAVVSTRAGGVSEVVGDASCGVLVEGGVDALAGALDRIVSEKETLLSLRTAARARAERCLDFRNTTAGFEATYEGVVARGSG